MFIGQNVAFRTDDETAAYAAIWSASLAPKHVEQRIHLIVFVAEVLLCKFGCRCNSLDVNHSGFHTLGNLGKRR